jgi:hypothetical protein
MKNKVPFIIFLLFGLALLIFLFTFDVVHAAKLESGVTITAPTTTVTEKICNDSIDNDNDGKIDNNDYDCAAAPAGSASSTTPCGLQIESVSLDYRFVFPGLESNVQRVTIKNEGPVAEDIMIKGGNWISDAAPNRTISAEITHVGFFPSTYSTKLPLTSSELKYTFPIYPGQSRNLDFQLKIPLSINGVSGVGGINTGDKFHQEVTIDCWRH